MVTNNPNNPSSQMYQFDLNKLQKHIGLRCPCLIPSDKFEPENLCPCEEFVNEGNCRCNLFTKV